LRGRCDSFVVETNVHFPTDINLLFDATRKVIELTTRLCEDLGVSGWRQSGHNIKEMKKQVFKLLKLKHSSSKDPIKALKKVEEIEDAYTKYAKMAKIFIEKAKASEKKLLELGVDPFLFDNIHYFATHAEKQIDLIIRRVIQGEKIPHGEKVFSVFEPHTEWVCKGKAGVPVELGLKVAILEDQIGFILGYQIMRNQTDEQVAVPIVQAAKDNFPNLNSCSFDKGFHSLSNQKELREILDAVALPKKGKLSKQEGEYQHSEKFKAIRKKHSAVESAINALEVHGLDRCPDKGINGFERYVGLAVVARNIQTIGSILIKREQRCLKKNRKRFQSAA
jgi:transposase, IS5 family